MRFEHPSQYIPEAFWARLEFKRHQGRAHAIVSRTVIQSDLTWYTNTWEDTVGKGLHKCYFLLIQVSGNITVNVAQSHVFYHMGMAVATGNWR